MPNIIIQSTPNVNIKNPDKLLKALSKTVWETGHFSKPEDIKARIIDLQNYLVGVEDDKNQNGFVFVEFKLMPGRSLEIRESIADKLLECLKSTLSNEQPEQVAVQFCVEVNELSSVYKKYQYK